MDSSADTFLTQNPYVQSISFPYPDIYYNDLCLRRAFDQEVNLYSTTLQQLHALGTQLAASVESFQAGLDGLSLTLPPSTTAQGSQNRVGSSSSVHPSGVNCSSFQELVIQKVDLKESLSKILDSMGSIHSTLRPESTTMQLPQLLGNLLEDQIIADKRRFVPSFHDPCAKTIPIACVPFPPALCLTDPSLVDGLTQEELDLVELQVHIQLRQSIPVFYATLRLPSHPSIRSCPRIGDVDSGDTDHLEDAHLHKDRLVGEQEGSQPVALDEGDDDGMGTRRRGSEDHIIFESIPSDVSGTVDNTISTIHSIFARQHLHSSIRFTIQLVHTTSERHHANDVVQIPLVVLTSSSGDSHVHSTTTTTTTATTSLSTPPHSSPITSSQATHDSIKASELGDGYDDQPYMATLDPMLYANFISSLTKPAFYPGAFYIRLFAKNTFSLYINQQKQQQQHQQQQESEHRFFHSNLHSNRPPSFSSNDHGRLASSASDLNSPPDYYASIPNPEHGLLLSTDSHLHLHDPRDLFQPSAQHNVQSMSPPALASPNGQQRNSETTTKTACGDTGTNASPNKNDHNDDDDDDDDDDWIVIVEDTDKPHSHPPSNASNHSPPTHQQQQHSLPSSRSGKANVEYVPHAQKTPSVQGFAPPQTTIELFHSLFQSGGTDPSAQHHSQTRLPPKPVGATFRRPSSIVNEDIFQLIQQQAYDQLMLVIDAKADVNIVDNCGQYALAHAVKSGNIAITELLLCSKADVNALGADVMTPLMVAAESGDSDMCRLLMKFHADVTIVDKYNRHALFYAFNSGDSDCCDYLLRFDSLKSPSTQPVVGQTNASSGQGTPPATAVNPLMSMRDRFGATPLIAAAQCDYAHTIINRVERRLKWLRWKLTYEEDCARLEHSSVGQVAYPTRSVNASVTETPPGRDAQSTHSRGSNETGPSRADDTHSTQGSSPTREPPTGAAPTTSCSLGDQSQSPQDCEDSAGQEQTVTTATPVDDVTATCATTTPTIGSPREERLHYISTLRQEIHDLEELHQIYQSPSVNASRVSLDSTIHHHITHLVEACAHHMVDINAQSTLFLPQSRHELLMRSMPHSSCLTATAAVSPHRSHQHQHQPHPEMTPPVPGSSSMPLTPSSMLPSTAYYNITSPSSTGPDGTYSRTAKSRQQQGEGVRITALHLAVQMGNITMVNALIHAGADLDIPFNPKCTEHDDQEPPSIDFTPPLTGSTSNDHMQIILSTGPTPLHWAVYYQQYRSVLRLLSAGAKPNSVDHFNRTPLMYACQQGLYNIVKLLLDSEGDLHHIDVTGNSALTYALTHSASTPPAEAGTQHTPPSEPDGSNGAHDNSVILLLLQHGARLNATDDNGYTPLMHATHRGAVQLVQLLLSYGALWINILNSEHKNALMIACEYGYLDIVQLLIRDARQQHGINAYELAYKYMDIDGKYAIQIAEENGHQDIIELLNSHGPFCTSYRMSRLLGVDSHLTVSEKVSKDYERSQNEEYVPPNPIKTSGKKPSQSDANAGRSYTNMVSQLSSKSWSMNAHQPSSSTVSSAQPAIPTTSVEIPSDPIPGKQGKKQSQGDPLLFFPFAEDSQPGKKKQAQSVHFS